LFLIPRAVGETCGVQALGLRLFAEQAERKRYEGADESKDCYALRVWQKENHLASDANLALYAAALILVLNGVRFR
jgi:hypothetical protein